MLHQIFFFFFQLTALDNLEQQGYELIHTEFILQNLALVYLWMVYIISIMKASESVLHNCSDILATHSWVLVTQVTSVWTSGWLVSCQHRLERPQLCPGPCATLPTGKRKKKKKRIRP